jgi:hypothetical protein
MLLGVELLGGRHERPQQPGQYRRQCADGATDRRLRHPVRFGEFGLHAIPAQISQRHHHRKIQTENRGPSPFVRRNFGADHLAHIENLVLVQAGGIVHVTVRSREVESANPILSRSGPSLMSTRRARMVEYLVNSEQ